MQMRSDQVEKVLSEYEELKGSTGDPELDAVGAAIFLEDAFGIVLSEAEIDPAGLADPSAVRRLVAAKLRAS
jgi:hypothetical protein